MKIVSESIKKAEDQWANVEIERWQQKKAGINPLRFYIKNVVNLIMLKIPDEVIKYTGITKYIIEDIITQDIEDGDLDKNVYQFYDEHVDVDKAAAELTKMIEEYINI